MQVAPRGHWGLLLAAISLALLGLSVPAAAQHLRGQVLDSVREPLDRAEVQILPNGAHAVTDAEGHFDLGLVAAGTYLIRVRRLGFRVVTKRVAFPLASGKLVVVLSPFPMMLDTVRTRLLEKQLPRVFLRMQEHLGATAFGPDLMKAFPGMSLDEILRADGELWSKLAGGQFFGCEVTVFIDGDSLPQRPRDVDRDVALSPSHNRASPSRIDLGLKRAVSMRDVAAVEVFNSPDFVHEPELDANRAVIAGTRSCTRIVMVWTNGYEQQPWAGH